MPTKAELEEENQRLRNMVAQRENQQRAFEKKVVSVARKYGEEYDWCDVMNEALEELEIKAKESLTVQVIATIQIEANTLHMSSEQAGEWLRDSLRANALNAVHFFDNDVEVEDAEGFELKIIQREEDM